jgi:penicillin-binding protein 1C
MKHLPYFVLSPIQEFFYKKSHLEFNSSPAIASYCIDETTIANFDLIYPRNGFKIYLPLDENGKKNDLIMNATHKSVHSKLYWYLDKEYIGETSRYHQIAVKPNRGRHELVITGEKGKSIKVYFDIIDKK